MQRRKMLPLGAIVLFAALTAGTAAAQQPQTPAGEASTNCFSTHLLGTMNICISEHGNIVRFESPAGFEHIRVGAFREGYAVCSNAFLGPTVVAHDAGDVEGGFNAVVVINQPVPNSLPLTITRTTTNGLELTQSYSIDSFVPELSVSVTMTVRNVSGATRYNVKLDRYFDGDVNGDVADDVYFRTNDIVSGNDPSTRTLELLDNALPAVTHATAVHTFIGWVPASCGQVSIATPTAAGDHVGRLSYTIGTLNNNASKTVKVKYRIS
jgi:hypothetical protein